MGHSFGCIVVSSILGGPNGEGKLPRPADSAVLVQGALSLWGYAAKIPNAHKPRDFRHVLENGLVSGPDPRPRNRRTTAPWASRSRPPSGWSANSISARGTFRAAEIRRHRVVGHSGHDRRREARHARRTRRLQAPGRSRIYNVDGSQFIPGQSGIDGPEVAHLQWQAVMAAGGQ